MLSWNGHEDAPWSPLLLPEFCTPFPSRPPPPPPQLYEPYAVLLRAHVPWWDERFRGWGGDKASGALVAARWGVRFAVHPAAFVVHVPHPVAASKALTEGLGLRGQVRPWAGLGTERCAATVEGAHT